MAPRIGPSIELPPDATAPDLVASDEVELGAQARREALRLRVRWLQELVGQAAFELGRRLVNRGELHRAEDVRMLRFAELSAVVARQACALSDACRERAVADAEAQVPPLPARFRLGDRGRPIPVRSAGQSGGGTGAGGGTAVGVVTRDEEDPPEGSVLVVGTLRPGLGPLLPKLSGIVSETGSVLSHLAILARESGVATGGSSGGTRGAGGRRHRERRRPERKGHRAGRKRLRVGLRIEQPNQRGAVMKSFAWFAGIATLVGALGYTAVSLARWEWNRALFFGMVFLAAEVGLAAALVLKKLPGVESSLTKQWPETSPARRALKATRPDGERFAWLRPDPKDVLSRTNVFITMVVGGGVLLSGGAWVIDKLASRTVDPSREARLGSELDAPSPTAPASWSTTRRP